MATPWRQSAIENRIGSRVGKVGEDEYVFVGKGPGLSAVLQR